jgi:MFS family permease
MKNESAASGLASSSSRSVLFNLSVFQFLTFLRRGVFYSFMINYLYMLMQTVTSTATLGTLNMIGSALGQNLLWGRICDRYRLRTRLIIIGETIAAFTYIIVFLVHTSLIAAGNSFTAGLSIIFGLSILEFFWSMSDVGWAALLTDITTPGTRGRIVGMLNFIASLGRTVGILFAGLLYNDGQGFRNGTIFYIVTVLLLIGVVLMTFTSRRMKTRNVTRETCTDKEMTQENKANEHDDRSERTYKWFLASLIVIVLGAASVSQIFLLFIKLPNGLYATDSEMSLILISWTVGGMIASLASGRLADKIGRSQVLMLGLVLAILTPVLYSLASDVPSMALTYGMNGVSFWIIQTVGFVFAGDLIPKHKRGRLLSRYNTVMALSWGPAGVLIGGPFADLQVRAFGYSPYTAYVNVFYVSSIILSVGTILFVLKAARLKREEFKV